MKQLTKKIIAAAFLVASIMLTASAGAFADELPQVEGKITQVMKDTGKITIKHGPIPNLDMGGMTMIFKAKDAKLLNGVKKGDKIMFTAIDEGGKLVVTMIKKGK